MSVTQITDDNIDTGIDASKLAGSVLPAMDGSALTGINVGTSLLKNGFNPAVDTNPADGVGAIWINTTTGQMFSCTDATTDQNTWTNMGSGTGHVTYTPPPQPFGGLGGGTISGYTSGGYWNGPRTTIDKFAFSSNVIATDVGDLTQSGRYNTTGCSSANFGYNAGGSSGSMWHVIDKFSFSTDGNATNVGVLTSPNRMGAAGQSSSTYGYISGGYNGSATITPVDKFSFSTDGNATNVANLNVSRYVTAGQSSQTHGYTTGYWASIEKFSFASDSSVILGGNLVTAPAPAYASGQSASYNGYISGGSGGSNPYLINKFSFTTDGDSSFVGYLSVPRSGVAGQSSTTNGYISGGNSSGQVNNIEKFSFTVDGDSIDHGDLTEPREQQQGQQV